MKRLLIAALVLTLAACEPKNSAAPPSIPGVKTLDALETKALWENPESYRGQRIAVYGYLMFEGHNRNLFAGPEWDKDWNAGRCMPVSIPDKESKPYKTADEKDGQMAWVIGKIDTVVKPDELSFDFCKDIGMIADTVR